MILNVALGIYAVSAIIVTLFAACDFYKTKPWYSLKAFADFMFDYLLSTFCPVLNTVAAAAMTIVFYQDVLSAIQKKLDEVR